MKGRVLIVAGSDSGGGAGLQADIKTVTALGGYAATAITALTAQDTTGVHAIEDVPVPFITKQMTVVLDDIGADAIKTGMLHRPEVIEAVAAALPAPDSGIPIVVDPVMVAKGGAVLLADEAHRALSEILLPRARVVTPNAPEAAHLTGITVRTIDDMRRAAEKIRAKGPRAVLVKGGHIDGSEITDLLVDDGEETLFRGPRIETRHTHGTGCTTASAIATGLAQGLGLVEAVTRARAYVLEAIRTAPGYGAGHGPLNHAHTVSGDRS
jgi:hydroxymethylpyrimidine/phosphomethylpyrimidine kinase